MKQAATGLLTAGCSGSPRTKRRGSLFPTLPSSLEVNKVNRQPGYHILSKGSPTWFTRTATHTCRGS